MYIEKKFTTAVWAVSGAVGALVVVALLFAGVYSPAQPYLIPLSQTVNNAFALCLMIIFGFPAVVEYNNYAWKKQVDQNIPRLLRDITESVRSGMTLPRALEEASLRNYGPVTKELERALSMFSRRQI